MPLRVALILQGGPHHGKRPVRNRQLRETDVTVPWDAAAVVGAGRKAGVAQNRPDKEKNEKSATPAFVERRFLGPDALAQQADVDRVLLDGRHQWGGPCRPTPSDATRRRAGRGLRGVRAHRGWRASRWPVRLPACSRWSSWIPARPHGARARRRADGSLASSREHLAALSRTGNPGRWKSRRSMRRSPRGVVTIASAGAATAGSTTRLPASSGKLTGRWGRGQLSTSRVGCSTP